ncbi:MAG: energy-coupling factor ABC transporter ATP-binding protein [Eggerthella lenta]
MDELDAREAAATVGYVAQSPENQIVCDSVWHELAFGLENLGVEQDEMRRRVAEVAHFFGIEPWFRRSVAELSGGQKQMTTLAGTLAMQPRLLLLDEPTAQLDPVAEKNFLHALFRVNRELGITVVVATHAPRRWPSTRRTRWSCGTGGCAPRSPSERFADREVLRAAQAGGSRPVAMPPARLSRHLSATPTCATIGTPPGCFAAATSTSPRATCTRSWAATAAGSRRCCARPRAC